MENKLIELEPCYFRRVVYNDVNNPFKIVVFEYTGENLNAFPEDVKLKGLSPGGAITFTAKGKYIPMLEGVSVKLVGEFQYEGKYGSSFDVKAAEYALPKTRSGVERLLGAIIPGVGPATAEEIFDEFGYEAIEIFKDEDRYKEFLRIRGFNEGNIDTKREEFLNNSSSFEKLELLSAFPGITENKLETIFEKYKHDTMAVLTTDPYQITEIKGIGFPTADKIALEGLSISPFDERRIRASLLYVLEQNELNGNTFLEQRDWLIEARNFILASADPNMDFNERNKLEKNVLSNLVALAKELKEKDKIGTLDISEKVQILENGKPVQKVNKQVAIYSGAAFEAEVGVAKELGRLLKSDLSADLFDVPDGIKRSENQTGIQYAKQQKRAIDTALSNPISVITGGPGTGKTTLVNVIKDIFVDEKPYSEVVMLAPTGRAAKRMSEATGGISSTIHSRLRIFPGSEEFKRKEDEEQARLLAQAGIVIVDEISMLDIFVFHKLLMEIDEGTRLVLIGDVDQLPSIGPGSVLKSLLETTNLPSVRLERVYRQGENSLIAENSQRINSGFSKLEFGETFKLVETKAMYGMTEESVAQKEVLEAYNDAIQRYGMDEVVLLTPRRVVRKAKDPNQHVVSTAADALNPIIRDRVNPENEDSEEFKVGRRIFRVGDKVMATVNSDDYANGDIGYIKAVHYRDNARKSIESVDVQFFGNHFVTSVAYEDFREFDWGYAMTVHKSQGSEYSCVILVTRKQDSFMLNKNLVYTGITRAKEEVILVGQQQAINIAVHKEVPPRRTMLKQLSEISILKQAGLEIGSGGKRNTTNF